MMINDIKHVFCIAMAKEADKTKDFIKRLPNCLKHCEYFNAIDGSLCHQPQWWTAPAGAWGCYRSHLNLIERAINEGWDNLLLLEVDAGFCDDFEQQLQSALNELPENWDCLYIGGQHIRNNFGVPHFYSDHLVIPYNCNRTHAWMLSKSGLPKIYKQLTQTNDWPAGYHIDHRLGQLHQNNVINVYACNPFIVSQEPGHSYIVNRDKPQRDWNTPECIKDTPLSKHVTIKYAFVGWGAPGLNNELGYEDKQVNDDDIEPGKITLSIHAPSTVVIDVSEPVTVFARVSKYGGTINPMAYSIDNKSIATLQRANQSSEAITLKPGRHTIEFKTNMNNARAMTYLVFFDEVLKQSEKQASNVIENTEAKRNETVDQVEQLRKSAVGSSRTESQNSKNRRVVGIEIITNSQCNRRCPGCNQHPIMQATPGYEFTKNDAIELIAAIENNNVEARLFFSGGEPALWQQLPVVMDIINASPNVSYTQVATSVVTEQNIQYLKKYFKQVCCSIRSDTADYLQNHPKWLEGVRLWDQREHVIFGKPAEQISCACVSQGIDFCVIQNRCWPCTLAASHFCESRWCDGDIGDHHLNDVLKQSPWPKPGTYQTCKTCSNNRFFRATGTKQKT